MRHVLLQHLISKDVLDVADKADRVNVNGTLTKMAKTKTDRTRLSQNNLVMFLQNLITESLLYFY